MVAVFWAVTCGVYVLLFAYYDGCCVETPWIAYQALGYFVASLTGLFLHAIPIDFIYKPLQEGDEQEDDEVDDDDLDSETVGAVILV